MPTQGQVDATAATKWPDIPKYPVVVSIGVLAIAATLTWWAHGDVSPLFATAEIRRGQFWRLLTTIFLHRDVLHLAFNLYWLWVLGTPVEKVYGHAKTALLIALFAVGSSSLDFALDRGGVGLSGVVYGLFGFLWAVHKRDQRFRGVVDPRTIALFIGWFLFCVATTVTHTFVVANVAHGAGAILGALTGYAIELPNRRATLDAAISAIILLGLWGSTLGRPIVNLSGVAGYEEGRWGYDALVANRNEEGVRWLRDAVKLQPKISVYWYDLGIAYERIGKESEALAAYQRAYALDPTNADYSRALGATRSAR